MQLDRLCRANGIEYHHVLQPNQYFAGSKPLGPAERREAILDESTYGESAAAAYPLLVREGRELVKQGVRFHDLTMLFATVHEQIYVDNCCHYNVTGTEMLATAIAREIAKGGAQ